MNANCWKKVRQSALGCHNKLADLANLRAAQDHRHRPGISAMVPPLTDLIVVFQSPVVSQAAQRLDTTEARCGDNMIGGLFVPCYLLIYLLSKNK